MPPARPRGLARAWSSGCCTRTGNVKVAVVGKYVELQRRLSLDQGSADPRRHRARDRGRDPLGALGDDRAEHVDAQLAASTPSSCPAASASAASRASSTRRATRARTTIPYLGVCLGLQIMVIEARAHVLGTDGRNSTEFDPQTPHPVISLLSEQHGIEDKGGTMRLGGYPCTLAARHEGRSGLRRRRGQRAPPPPLRVQQRVPRAAGALRA